MDEPTWPGGTFPDAERETVALLDEHGARLYRYCWLMLGDRVSATHALTDTVVAALPHVGRGLSPGPLFAFAQAVCRQYRPAAAVPDARAEAATLAAVTTAALRRLDPDDRELCVLSAPRYRLAADDLAAITGTQPTEAPRIAFARELAACASEAGLTPDDDLTDHALRMFGSDPIPVPYDQIVPLAADPALAGLRDDVRARVGVPARLAAVVLPAPRNSVYLTAPLPRLSATSTRVGRRRVRAAGTVLLAGAIPAAIAGAAWAGHSHTTRPATSAPLEVVSGGPPSATSPAPAPRPHRASASPKPSPTAQPTTAAPLASPTDMPWTMPATTSPTATPAASSPTASATPSASASSTPAPTQSPSPTPTYTPDPVDSLPRTHPLPIPSPDPPRRLTPRSRRFTSQHSTSRHTHFRHITGVFSAMSIGRTRRLTVMPHFVLELELVLKISTVIGQCRLASVDHDPAVPGVGWREPACTGLTRSSRRAGEDDHGGCGSDQHRVCAVSHPA